MNQTTAAYVAGLIDGEGCITIAKSKSYFGLRIDVGMTRPGLPALRLLREKCGGKIRRTRDATEQWAAAWAWGLFGPSVAELLRAITPYLVVKQDQANLALSFQWAMDKQPRRPNGSVMWTPHLRTRCMQIHLAMQELNRKGPSVVEGGGDWFARLVGGIWVTPQRDLFSDLLWATFSETWPSSGTMRSGAVYPLRPWVLPIYEDGSSLWPSPQTQYDGRSMEAWTAAKKKMTDRHKRGEYAAGPGPMDRRPECDDDLPTRVERYPTPRASGLTMGGGSNTRKAAAARGMLVSGALNPMWVEWLMGFPPGWTDLELSETPSSRKSPSTSDAAL